VKAGLRWLVFLLGLGLVGWYVCRAGPEEILKGVSQLGWWMPLVFMPYLLVYFLDTWGWYLAFGAYATVRPAYLTLFRVRWAAESINSIIPSAYIAGEALKVYLLHKRGFPGITASTSVVASKTCQILAQVFFIGLGAIAAMITLPATHSARAGMMIIALAALSLVGSIFLLQRRGMFSSFHGLLSRFSGFKALKKSQSDLRTLDDQIYAFYRRDRLRFFRTTAAFLAGWLCDAIEVYVVCWLLGLRLTWTEAIAIEAFIGVAKGVGFFVPGALGVQESGVMLLFKIFGLPSHIALVYAVIRRGRDLLFVLIGGALLYSEEASFKQVLDHAAKESLSP
jgi:putative membrane protein